MKKIHKLDIQLFDLAPVVKKGLFGKKTVMVPKYVATIEEKEKDGMHKFPQFYGTSPEECIERAETFLYYYVRNPRKVTVKPNK